MKVYKQRQVPEELNFPLEICLQRDGINPHSWVRKGDREGPLAAYNPLYCTTNLTDDEWELYLELAYCELTRGKSATPGCPHIPERLADYEEISAKTREILERIGENLGEDYQVLVPTRQFEFDLD